MRAPRGSGARPPAAVPSAGGGFWAGLRAPQDWHLCARWGHLSRGLFSPARVPHLLFGDAVGMTPWIEDPVSSVGASVRVCTASYAALPHSKTPRWSEVAAAPASPFQRSRTGPSVTLLGIVRTGPSVICSRPQLLLWVSASGFVCGSACGSRPSASGGTLPMGQ